MQFCWLLATECVCHVGFPFEKWLQVVADGQTDGVFCFILANQSSLCVDRVDRCVNLYHVCAFKIFMCSLQKKALSSWVRLMRGSAKWAPYAYVFFCERRYLFIVCLSDGWHITSSYANHAFLYVVDLFFSYTSKVFWTWICWSVGVLRYFIWRLTLKQHAPWLDSDKSDWDAGDKGDMTLNPVVWVTYASWYHAV